MKKNFNLPILGAGAGLRHEHFDQILQTTPDFKWFEVISDDFMDFGGYSRERLMQISERYQLISHGVCLAIGSTDPLDREYLRRLKKFCLDINRQTSPL